MSPTIKSSKMLKQQPTDKKSVPSRNAFFVWLIIPPQVIQIMDDLRWNDFTYEDYLS